MLPFLKPKQVAVTMMKEREPDEGSEDNSYGLKSAAEDLISAIHSKDVSAVAAALKAAHEICESYDPMDEEAGE